MNHFNLKEFRTYMNITQKEIIEKIRVPNVTITQIENGRIPLSKSIKQKIFEAYNIDAKKYE